MSSECRGGFEASLQEEDSEAGRAVEAVLETGGVDVVAVSMER